MAKFVAYNRPRGGSTVFWRKALYFAQDNVLAIAIVSVVLGALGSVGLIASLQNNKDLIVQDASQGSSAEPEVANSNKQVAGASTQNQDTDSSDQDQPEDTADKPSDSKKTTTGTSGPTTPTSQQPTNPNPTPTDPCAATSYGSTKTESGITGVEGMNLPAGCTGAFTLTADHEVTWPAGGANGPITITGGGSQPGTSESYTVVAASGAAQGSYSIELSIDDNGSPMPFTITITVP